MLNLFSYWGQKKLPSLLEKNKTFHKTKIVKKSNIKTIGLHKTQELVLPW